MAAQRLNLHDRHAVRRNIVDRCGMAIAKYAFYLLGNASATQAQKGWTREAQ